MMCQQETKAGGRNQELLPVLTSGPEHIRAVKESRRGQPQASCVSESEGITLSGHLKGRQQSPRPKVADNRTENGVQLCPPPLLQKQGEIHLRTTAEAGPKCLRSPVVSRHPKESLHSSQCLLGARREAFKENIRRWQCHAMAQSTQHACIEMPCYSSECIQLLHAVL